MDLNEVLGSGKCEPLDVIGGVISCRSCLGFVRRNGLDYSCVL